MIDANSFGSYPIVGPTDSVIRFMRGETVSPDEIEADQTRSDLWAVTKEQYRRWAIIYPDKAAHHPLNPPSES